MPLVDFVKKLKEHTRTISTFYVESKTLFIQANDALKNGRHEESECLLARAEASIKLAEEKARKFEADHEKELRAVELSREKLPH